MRAQVFHRWIGAALCLSLGWWMWRGLIVSADPSLFGPAAYYVANTASDTGASNIVAAILFDYRGFDTFGEATVIYTTVCGVAMLFAKRRLRRSSWGLSPIVKRGMGMMVPFILVYASSIVIMGHITPGGGFQGGAVFATVTVLFCVIYGSKFEASRISPKVKEVIESSGALLFAAVGLWGLAEGAGFLANLDAGFSSGPIGSLLSGGAIPLLNIAVGMKVGAGLSTLFYSMIKILEDPAEGPPPEV